MVLTTIFSLSNFQTCAGSSPKMSLKLTVGFCLATFASASLLGLDQNDPELIKKIAEKFDKPDYEKGYNFSGSPDTKGQYGQAVEVEKLFKGKKNGFFIEAGAYDGENLSNTLLFEAKLNWTGLLVEPNPDLYQSLKSKNRKALGQ